MSLIGWSVHRYKHPWQIASVRASWTELMWIRHRQNCRFQSHNKSHPNLPLSTSASLETNWCDRLKLNSIVWFRWRSDLISLQRNTYCTVLIFQINSMPLILEISVWIELSSWKWNWYWKLFQFSSQVLYRISWHTHSTKYLSPSKLHPWIRIRPHWFKCHPRSKNRCYQWYHANDLSATKLIGNTSLKR